MGDRAIETFELELPMSYDLERMAETGFKGILAVEAASGYWGMSSYDERSMPIFFAKTEWEECDRNIFGLDMKWMFIYELKEDNIVRIKDGLYVTSRERTVCDMVKYECHEFHLYETVISAYEDGETDIEKMESIAEEYGILDKLRETYEEALIAEEEDSE